MARALVGQGAGGRFLKKRGGSSVVSWGGGGRKGIGFLATSVGGEGGGILGDQKGGRNGGGVERG